MERVEHVLHELVDVGSCDADDSDAGVVGVGVGVVNAPT